MPGPGLTFSVDTHVFRELGELLVGRDSTALLELIKNAYDADATRIVVTAVNLDVLDHGRIVVEDNGCGMDETRFVNGFLRIASRYKEEGARRSEHFRRRYTGSKGIGRLAAHKLAKFMEVHSVCGVPQSSSSQSIRATIDWERIESKPTLGALSDEIHLEAIRLPRAKHPGTVITLSRLRRPWTDRERVRFVAECRSFEVPKLLRAPLPSRLLGHPLLFATPVLRDSTSNDPGCEIKLEGEFDEGDDYWERLVDATNWVLEIDCKSDKRLVRYAVAPTKPTSRAYIKSDPRRFEHAHSHPDEGPFFQARILVRDQQIHNRDVLNWSRQMSGVRVYMEGFRVLPYGGPGDDWLGLDSSTSRRSWQSDEVLKDLVAHEDEAGDWQVLGLANRSYTGAVFLTQEDAPTLQMLVNREGFVAERAYDTMVEIVKRGIDLLTRTRAAATAEARRQKRVERELARQTPKPNPVNKALPADTLRVGGSDIVPQRTLTGATANAMETVQEARRLLATTADPVVVSQRLELAQTALAQVVTVADRVGDTAAMLRVLASLGTLTAGFVHEIRGLLGTAVALHESIDRIRADKTIRGDSRTRLNAVFQSLGDLRRQIERQAAYLVDLTSTDARRRRSRQRLSDRFDSASRLVSPTADRRGIGILNEIPVGLKSPPMFPAELTAVFSNLLTNAVKAAGDQGSIRARGSTLADGGAVLVVENTGIAVDLADSEKWFLPFESTSSKIESALGYGMGLGLTITRDVLEQYGATIRFVAPDPAYATAVEIQFSGGRESS